MVAEISLYYLSIKNREDKLIMKNDIRKISYTAIGILIGVPFVLLLGTFGAIIAVVLGAIGFFTAEIKAENQAAKSRREAECFYSESQKRLHITTRVGSNKKVLCLTEYRADNYGYTPEKLVYTGATFGGITTGGFHKEGGLYANKGVRSGRYVLNYLEGANKQQPIEIISFSAEVLEEAKASPISKYLSGSVIHLKTEKGQISNTALNAFQNGQLHIAFNANEMLEAECYPTFEKATEIMNWICGS